MPRTSHLGPSCHRTLRQTMTVWCRWLLVLYLLATGAPVLQALTAQAAVSGQSAIELCSAGGIRRVVLDRDGRPVAPEPAGQHAGHDCPGCLTGCHAHALCPPAAAGVTPAWPVLARLAGDVAAAPRRSLAGRPPLPARGPPTLS